MPQTVKGKILRATGLLCACLLSGVATSGGTSDSSPAAEARIRAELEAGHFAEAETLAREHRATALREHGESSPECARATDLLVEALLGGGKALSDETESLARQDVAWKESLAQKESGRPGSARSGAELGVSLTLLGRLHLDRGDSAQAVSVTRRALELQEASAGKSDALLIPTVRGLGNALLANGDLAGAEEAYRRLGDLVAQHEGKRSMDAASVAYNTARLMIEVGDWEEARRLYQDSADIVEDLQGESSARLAYALLGVGNADTFLGNPTAALESLERSLAVAQKTLRPDHPFLALCHTGLGYAWQELGDLDAARQAFAKALALARREYGPAHEETGRALRLLAGAARQARDLDQAESSLAEAMAIFASSPNRNLLWEAGMEQAQLQADRGRTDEALAQMQKILRETTERFPDHPDVINRSDVVADLLLRSGRPEEARNVLLSALGKLPDVGADHLGTIRARAHLALASALTGRRDEALEGAVRAETLEIERARILIAGLSEQRALRFVEERTEALDLLVTLAATAPSTPAQPAARTAAVVQAAWSAAIQSRGLVLEELARRHRLAVDVASPETEAFAVASRRLANLIVHGSSGDAAAYAASLSEARRRREEAERALARVSNRFRSLQEERAIGFEQVRDALPPESALVAYVLYDRILEPDPRDPARIRPVESRAAAQGPRREYAAFVSGGRAAPRLIRLGGGAEVDAAVQSVRTALRAGLQTPDRASELAYREAARNLKRLVWDPVATRVGSPKRVFIVPDGALHLVNFATFPSGKEEYLAETGPIFHDLSAEREMARHDGPVGHGLLALGGPAYDTDVRPGSKEPAAKPSAFRGAGAGCPSFVGFRFEPLRSAAAEAKSVAGQWSDRFVHGADASVLLLSGPEAVEGTFKRMAPGRRVLHLATHGFFLDGDCPSALAEHRGFGGLSDDSAAAPTDNPLVLSGLALAGANRRQQAGPDAEDGILTAEEIAALDLRGAEWAVLSGCDTGLGVIRPGEGVFGLRRAFSIAGARTLIMTLWPVGDDNAAEWIDKLYEKRLGAGLDTAASVSAATATVLARRRREGLSTHPVLWGAFVASGDWR